MGNKNTFKSTNFDKFIISIIFFLIFIISLFFTPFYYEGDQVFYNDAYNAVKNKNIINGFIDYQFHINSQEPIHFFIDWVFSNIGIDKNVVMSFFNALLASFFTYYFISLNTSYLVIFPTIFLNFYFIVLYFAAERLKFGFLFLILALLNQKDKKKQIFYLLLSIASHTQIILYLLAKIFSNFCTKLFLVFKNHKFKFTIFKYLYILIFILPLYFLSDHIYFKFIAYSSSAINNSFISNIWQPFIFMIISLIYTKQKLDLTLMFVFIIFSSLILGPERITMMAFFLLFNTTIQYKRGLNLGTLICLIYFSIKSIPFIIRILETGQGF
jgi:hypothetical protein